MITEWAEFFMLKALRLVRTLHLDRLIRMGGSSSSFTDFFRGFEDVDAVRRIFGEKTGEVLRNLKVEFTPIGGYMWVNDANGHLMISSRYLNEGDRIDIYLDLIHELVHVKQFMEGRELFDSQYTYIERPTEVEAYRHAVKEARKLGLTDERIREYLEIDWMSDEDLQKLAETLNVNCHR